MTIMKHLKNHPCNTPCVYCKLLSETETDHFTSVSTEQSYKIRQSINCQSKNVIYMVKCVKCNLQGVGHSKKFSKRTSNYFSQIEQKRRTCNIGNHFIDHHMDEWKENYKDNNLFQITGTAILTNLQSNEQLKSKRLEEFKGYWQVKLATIHPHGLNSINELNTRGLAQNSNLQLFRILPQLYIFQILLTLNKE